VSGTNANCEKVKIDNHFLKKQQSDYNLICFNPLTHGPQANQPYKFKMPNAQKIKWDKSHTLSIPLQVHLV
jgi:hypothetical protein